MSSTERTLKETLSISLLKGRRKKQMKIVSLQKRESNPGEARDAGSAADDQGDQ